MKEKTLLDLALDMNIEDADLILVAHYMGASARALAGLAHRVLGIDLGTYVAERGTDADLLHICQHYGSGKHYDIVPVSDYSTGTSWYQYGQQAARIVGNKRALNLLNEAINEQKSVIDSKIAELSRQRQQLECKT